jgi:hypothetical protein
MGYAAHMEDRRHINRVSVGKPEGKLPFVIPKHRWKMSLKCILKVWGIWLGLIWFNIEPTACYSEYCHNALG